MRFVLKLVSLFFLVVAVIAGVVDAIETVSTGAYSPTILGQAWFQFSPETLNVLQASVQRYIHPALWDPVIQWILLKPAALVFLGLALIFYLPGYRRRKPADRFAA